MDIDRVCAQINNTLHLGSLIISRSGELQSICAIAELPRRTFVEFSNNYGVGIYLSNDSMQLLVESGNDDLREDDVLFFYNYDNNLIIAGIAEEFLR